MYKIQLDWADLKSDIISKGFIVNYRKTIEGYEVFVIDRAIIWTSFIVSSSDIEDFENNYKSNCNICIYDSEGKQFTRAESRPLDTTTNFTCRGDSVDNIGDGNFFKWDFSNEDLDIEAPSGMRRQRIEFSFKDSVWIKEGTLYFYNMPKGSYLNFYVVCPQGGYYKDNDGNIKQATEDTIISHYVNSHFMEGTVAMGDELNTEACSCEVLSYLKFWIDVTIPDEYPEAHGNFELEIYRRRTTIL